MLRLIKLLDVAKSGSKPVVAAIRMLLKASDELVVLVKPMLEVDDALLQAVFRIRERVGILEQQPVPRVVIDEAALPVRIRDALLHVAGRLAVIPRLEMDEGLVILVAIGAGLLHEVDAADLTDLQFEELGGHTVGISPLRGDTGDVERKLVVESVHA